jgi:cyclophilin family peptidyl-prolyl cis-trans isomerase/HEAT repeat protein
MYRAPALFLLMAVIALAAGCASAPPVVVPVTVPFETKMSWILRLEDQRILRDAGAPVAPPPLQTKTTGKKGVVPPPPPPPPDIIRLLRDPEARIRRRAALAAGRVGLPDALPDLMSALRSDTDPEVRQMAAFALGLLGDKQPSTLEALRAALIDPSPLVTGRAAEALGLIGDAPSAPEIGKVVTASLGAVSALAPDDSGYPLEPAAEAFRLGVYALARLKAYDALAAAVLSPDGQPRVQWWPVAYALQRVDDKRALPALLTLAKSRGAYTRGFAVKGLGAVKDPSAVPLLIPMLDPTNPASGVTLEAVRALGSIADKRAVDPLMKLARTNTLPVMLRADALRAAAASGLDTTQDFVTDMLSDPAPTMRAAAFEVISKNDDDSFMAVLSGLDPDPHWSVRAGLATALGTKDAERALPKLMRMLSDSDERVIPAVLTSLVKLKAPDLGKILLEHLAKDDSTIRTYAADALGDVKPDGAADALVAAFTRAGADGTYTVRAAVLAALAKFGAAPALPTLRVALTDKDWAVRVRAADVLKTLDPTMNTAQAIRPAPGGRAVRYDTPALVDPKVAPHVYFDTDKGTIEIELDVLDAPLTCDNFIALVGKGYFEGIQVHRLVPDFVAQAGDPRGDGEGGPGYTIRDELNEEPYLRGTVGMALDYRDTGGSQFFITYSPQPHLDARYTVFGRVVSGMDVVDKLTQWDVLRRVRVWTGAP